MGDKWSESRPKWRILVWLPANLADRFKVAVRKGKRTAFITEAIEEKLVQLKKQDREQI